MAIKTVWQQKIATQALDARRIYRSLVDNPGIVSGFTVSPTSPTTMTVNISAGRAFVSESGSTLGGSYHVVNDDVMQATIGASNATLNRKDKIVLTVRDSFISGPNNDAIIQVIAGTAGSGTVNPPATPANSIVLAVIDVPAAATSITAARILTTNLTDLARMSYSMTPQSIKCLSTKRPTTDLVDGLRIIETDTGIMRIYNNGNWKYLAGDVSAGGVISKVLSQTTAQKKIWKVTAADAVIRAGMIQGVISFSRAGSVLSVPTSGDSVNSSIGTLVKPFIPAISTPISTTSTGRMLMGYATSAGTITASNFLGSADVAVGYSFIVGFTAPIHSSFELVSAK